MSLLSPHVFITTSDVIWIFETFNIDFTTSTKYALHLQLHHLVGGSLVEFQFFLVHNL